MDPYIAFFHEIDLDQVAEVGGKGAHLGQLTRWGFPVPPGFCVKVSAFQAFLEQGGLAGQIRGMASGLDPSDVEGLEKTTASIRERIESQTIPEPIEASIRRAWNRLGEKTSPSPLVAVRSSVGTRDGSRSSFPGQMDTYHHIRGIEQVLHRILQCWASVWTGRAASTRLRLGLGPDDVVIAPLVQVMVPSDVAGVLFTADPLTGDRERLLVNAAFGLGEAVVSGNMTPDQFVLSRQDGKEISRRIGRKDFKIVLDEGKGSGTLRVDLGEQESRESCLTDGQITELASAGIRIEEHLGHPQDIEWAFHEGELFILQTRKIVGLETAPAPSGGEEEELPDEWESEFDTRVGDPPCVYTSANISEVLPGILSPLTSYGLKALDYGFWKPNDELGLHRVPFPEDMREHLYLGFFYGRPHLNLTLFRDIAAKVPGGAATEFDRPLPRDALEEDVADGFALRPKALFVFSRFLVNSIRMLRRVPRELALYRDQVQEEYREFRQLDLQALSMSELVEMLERDPKDAWKVMSLHIENSIFAVSFYELLRKLCARWLDDPSGTFAARLVTGLATLESARPNREIFALYRIAAASKDLKELFQGIPPGELLDELRKAQGLDARTFLEKLDAFLFRYGYRSVNEAELMLPSWDRDPSFVLSMIKNLLNTEDPEDPKQVEERRSAERIRAETEARQRLSYAKWRLFRWVLNQTQTYMAGRENNKAILMMGVHGVKNVIFELSHRLYEQGVLGSPDDLYFLTEEEVIALCRGERFHRDGRIERRRREWNWNHQVTLPEVFQGRPKPIKPGEDGMEGADASGGTLLEGLGVNPGRVTGRARVILDPRRDAHIEKGEILVAPVTDAGWTPLFLIASAIVVDVGGLLSHGSIVAREYGIPGVLNVLNATKRIRTGQMLTVDGSKGEVLIHPGDAD